MSKWNPQLYSKYIKERTQPAIDLANHIHLTDPTYILDIGCGPGNSTQVLKDKYPNATVIGIDNSDEMIEAAKRTYPNCEFVVMDAKKIQFDHKFDLIFSNSCIQWLDDHAEYIIHTMNYLNKGGVFAVQIPLQTEMPIHRIIEKTADSMKWKKKFKQHRIFYNLTQSEYFDILSAQAKDFDVWETIYYHRMNSHKDILDWYESTGLRPYLDQLNLEDQKEFKEDLYNQIVKAYPVQTHGEVIFYFHRLFFTANK